MKSKGFILVVGLVALAFMFYLGRHSAPSHDHGAVEIAAGEESTKEKQAWTCSMHPQIRQPKPGLCPICNMELIPANSSGGGDLGPRTLSMSDSAKALAKIETAVVERRQPEVEVDLYGKIAWDETRVKTVSAYFPGRIDRLFIDYTGIPVRAGDHLAEIYSPDLLSAQAELISAKKFNNENLVRAAREKLRLWGFSSEQIQRIEQTEQTSDRLEINSPLSGVVIHKNIHEGEYVKTGTPFFKIADASGVWLLLDAYESDLPWLRFRQQVAFTVEGVPGETFTGQISFIAPELDERTRTIKVRVNAENPKGRLKPGMFARATITSTMAGGGNAVSADLLKKWMCPMHPEVIADEKESCPICGMDLVKVSEMGYVADATKDEELPLLIPASAPLITGKRAIVYVEVPDAERPTYEGRRIVLGARSGDFYTVEKGLREGERVVTQGGFLLDASLQISAKPSMMSEDEAELHAQFHAPPAFSDQLLTALQGYYAIQERLATDDFDGAQKATRLFSGVLEKVDMQLLIDKTAHETWMSTTKVFTESAQAIEKAEDLKAVRVAFEAISEHLIFAVRAFGTNGDVPIHLTHCPMAFKGKGGNWLQAGPDVRNPYLGKVMLECGEMKENLSEIRAGLKQPVAATEGHQH